MDKLRVAIRNRQKSLEIDAKAIKPWVGLLVRDYLEVPCHEVVLHFVTKKRISKLHFDLFGDPSPTDCISLPLDDPKNPLHYCIPYLILGEVFVSPEVAIEYAQKRGKDPCQETALYIIHGLLHLLGFDDVDPKMRRIMRSEELWCLKTYDCRIR